jgi:predicted DNA-binding protein (UPF0251 family)
MARVKKERLVQKAPHYGGFKPLGLQSKSRTEVKINFEEYEALKLCDYELLTQAESAILMNISRPTFTRIYESARRKIAKALVEGSLIYFEGGKVAFANWYKCSQCKITFTLDESADRKCPLCKTTDVTVNN